MKFQGLPAINFKIPGCSSIQYLESVRPILSEERFKKMEKLAEEFKVRFTLYCFTFTLFLFILIFKVLLIYPRMDSARGFNVTWFGNLGGPQTMYVINIIGAGEPQSFRLTRMEIKTSF